MRMRSDNASLSATALPPCILLPHDQFFRHTHTLGLKAIDLRKGCQAWRVISQAFNCPIVTASPSQRPITKRSVRALDAVTTVQK